MSDSYFEISKERWYQKDAENNEVDIDRMTFGCLQRIALSLEKMERPFNELISSEKYIRDMNSQLLKENKKYLKIIAWYKGAIKRMKVKS